MKKGRITTPPLILTSAQKLNHNTLCVLLNSSGRILMTQFSLKDVRTMIWSPKASETATKKQCAESSRGFKQDAPRGDQED